MSILFCQHRTSIGWNHDKYSNNENALPWLTGLFAMYRAYLCLFLFSSRANESVSIESGDE